MGEKRDIQAPSSVKAYETAVHALPAGSLFEEMFPEGLRANLTCLYGGAFFALARLAPELLERSQISIAMGGQLSVLIEEGGRWLSLFGKALQYDGKISCTLCTSAKPKSRRVLRRLLVQSPQFIVGKYWPRYLRESEGVPDALLLYPHSTFGKYKELIEELLAAKYTGKILIACRARAEVVVLQRLLHAYGFAVDEPAGFAYADGEVRALVAGAWWLSVGARQEDALPPDERELERLRNVYRAFQSAIDSADNYDHATAIATAYGRRGTIQVGGEIVPDVVMMSDTAAIDLTTGRWLRRGDAAEQEAEASFAFDGVTLDAAIVGLVPQIKAGEPPIESEIRLLTWMVRALEAGVGSEDGSSDDELNETTEEPAESDEEPASESVPSTVGAARADLPAVSAAPPSTVHKVRDQAPAEQNSITARLRIPRSRLSRGAGAVNVLAIAARLGQGGADEAAFAAARSRIMKWVSNKGFGEIPAGGNYHIETSEGEVTVETDSRRVWALRFDDRKQMEGGAFWRVELSLNQASQATICLRLYQVRRSERAPAPVSGVPKVLTYIANEVGLSDLGVPLRAKARRLVGRADAELLAQVLLMQDRVLPFIVVSVGRGPVPEASVDRLAERLVGAAHVVLIDHSVSDELIRRFGRERSVFGNAIRLYRPGFTADSDPFQHRIWTYSGSLLSPHQANDIAEEVCAISLEVGDLEDRVPSFVAIRNQISQDRLTELRRLAANVAATPEEERARQLEIQKNLESELKRAKEWVKELEARNDQLEKENRTLIGERDDALEQERQIRHRLNIHFDPNYGTEEEIEEEALWYPDSWELMDDWVDSYGDGKLVLLPSAIKAARESAFHVDLSYKALELLAKYYVPMRTRSAEDNEPWKRFNQALNELGLECGPTGDATSQHRYKKDYQRKYEGRTITLDMHLKKGLGHNPEAVFRLYFYYDEQAEKVVVGHLPTHLTNSKTH